MAAVCLRRRKDMKFINLKLPELSSHLLRIKLNSDEKKKYDALRVEAKDLMDVYRDMRDNEDQSRHKVYMNILEVLLRLRQCCNHWRLCEKRLSAILKMLDNHRVVTLNEENIKALQALLQVQIESEEDCPICLTGFREPVVTACKHCFCRPCIERWFLKNKHCPLCRQPSDVSKLVAPAEDMAEDDAVEAGDEDSSSKIVALIKILTAKGQTPGTKTVVFSQWTSFLNLFEPHLLKYNIHFTRIDGKMKANQRDEAMEKFRDDESCTVMLASLSVCSVGLNLVAANQVILTDSWWAPAIEDQAVDRVYRLGQTRPTTIWRLVVEDSIEDRVLDVQKRKRELMNAAFKEKETASSREARIADIERLIR
ncbi:ornithine carbamoyltransferase [Ascosphaera pollenicola]|nr:ornithine carbamoyltransferase [Ascosphaera pollenicola]